VLTRPAFIGFFDRAKVNKGLTRVNRVNIFDGRSEPIKHRVPRRITRRWMKRDRVASYWKSAIFGGRTWYTTSNELSISQWNYNSSALGAESGGNRSRVFILVKCALG
jgi:hypothetical protein